MTRPPQVAHSLIISSKSLQSNYDQQTAFRAFLHRKVPFSHRGKVLPLWYQAFFLPNVSQLGILYLLGFAASLARYFDQSVPSGHGYYLGCAIFTAAHVLFSPWAWEGLKGFSNVSARPEDTEKALRTWLNVSLVRLVAADFPAWICAVLGALRQSGV